MRRTLTTAALAGLLLAPATATHAGPAKADSTAVKAAIEAFKDAGTRHDTDAVGALLHDGFRVVFTWTHEPGVTVMDKATYLNLLGAKKIGGSDGTVRFGAVDVRDELAVAEATIERADATFRSSFTLIRVDDAWQIVQDAVAVEKK
mgnify:CR=1 FL=1